MNGVCLYVCVCVRAQERNLERERGWFYTWSDTSYNGDDCVFKHVWVWFSVSLWVCIYIWAEQLWHLQCSRGSSSSEVCSRAPTTHTLWKWLYIPLPASLAKAPSRMHTLQQHHIVSPYAARWGKKREREKYSVYSSYSCKAVFFHSCFTWKMQWRHAIDFAIGDSI